ncbi:MAG: hypothetical protein EPN22_07625 [Nitrospirae bacterium]|nr:MAG: hypothetical protein EPN22_07625 [Nitrospirota bacterium]
MVFIDGIRHAVEIADLAYNRLVTALTEMARGHITGNADGNTKAHFARHYTSAFLDAWAFVDATDRVRTLIQQMPNVADEFMSDERVESFIKLSQEVRQLRNVADHLAQRIDYVVAKESTALGVLTWITFVDDISFQHLTCVLRPGTMYPFKKMELVNPVGQAVVRPTSLVHLAAGEYRVCISDVWELMRPFVAKLEDSVEGAIAGINVETPQAGSDIFIALHSE